MSGILVKFGEANALQRMVSQDIDLKLYKNDRTPARGDTAADYTEADFTGYAAKQLASGSWVVTERPTPPSDATYPTQTFTSTAGGQNQDVYGYYLALRATGDLIAAERFADGPYDIRNAADAIEVDAVLTMQADA